MSTFSFISIFFRLIHIPSFACTMNDASDPSDTFMENNTKDQEHLLNIFAVFVVKVFTAHESYVHIIDFIIIIGSSKSNH